MSESFLPYYNRELGALRNLAARFAETHPKVAGRLRLAPDSVDDPHVARLLEGAAFLSARVQQRLDDEFPEITDALLGVLYPHYLAPTPSGAIAQFSCQADLRVPVTVPVHTSVETDPIRGEPCRFRTTSKVTLWPIEIESVRLTGLPLAAPINPSVQAAQSSLRIVLRTTDPEVNFAELALGTLQVFLRGASEQSLPLYELLCGHTLGVALADGPNDARPTLVPAGSVRPAGFGPEEGLYPWPARSFSGFRLLSEYFALPEKFLFIDFHGLDARTLVHTGNRLEIFVYFDRPASDLERRLQPDCMALGCVPMVNLFPRKCEPIPLTHQETEYLIAADHRRPRAFEVWSVTEVRALRGDGTAQPWRPFYRHPAEATGTGEAGFYHLMRRHSPDELGGTDVYLAPFDTTLSVDQAADTVLSIDALCTNRDLPAALPFGGGQPLLHLSEGISAVTGVRCITAPTAPLRAPLRERRNWRLISHLSLSHLSIIGGDAGADSLREVLRLYDLRDTAVTRASIGSLLSISSTPGIARIPDARPGGFCRGIDVTLTFDPRIWESAGLYLLSSVIERFLGLHTTVNSFVRTSVRLQGQPGMAARFPARAGARVLA